MSDVLGTNNELATLLNELNKAYAEIEPWLREKLIGKTYSKYDYTKQPHFQELPTTPPPVPVITVQPKGKRKGDSWYVPNVWTSETDEALAALTGDENPVKDEIVIATSALNQGAKYVVAEMVKQMIHQEIRHRCDQNSNYYRTTITPTGWVTQTYSDHAMRIGYYRADDSNSNKDLEPNTNTAKWKEYDAELDRVIATLDDSAFTIHRKDKKGTTVQNPLKKWSCACSNIRTAVYVDLTCNICGEPVKYADKDWDDDDVKDNLKAEAKNFDSTNHSNKWSRSWRLDARRERIRKEKLKAGMPVD